MSPARAKGLPVCVVSLRFFSDSRRRAGLGAGGGLLGHLCPVSHLIGLRTGGCWVTCLASLDPLTVCICHMRLKIPPLLPPLRGIQGYMLRGVSKAICSNCIFRTSDYDLWTNNGAEGVKLLVTVPEINEVHVTGVGKFQRSSNFRACGLWSQAAGGLHGPPPGSEQTMLVSCTCDLGFFTSSLQVSICS